MNISKNILIIANGKFPRISVIKDILSLNPSIVCCDGAAEKAYRNNINPDVIIGDMDSMNSNLN
jgi:thiamine pyrophosphokinase